ncbi:MAG: DinB family protein [Dehalococcoidia bacterium]
MEVTEEERQEPLEALAASRDEVLRVVSANSATLGEGRYERGWDGRQILAHLASIEWTYPRLLDVAHDAAPSGGGPVTREMRGGNDAYNDRQVAKRAGASVVELLAEFTRNRAATIAAIESASLALLARPIRSAGGREGPLIEVFHAVTVEHVRGHLTDLAGQSGA